MLGTITDLIYVYPAVKKEKEHSKNMKKRYYKKIWGMVGFVVNLSQMIEYNLANILALNEILVAFDKEESMYKFEYAELLKKQMSGIRNWIDSNLENY